jgi:hypothetical protein
VTVEQRLVAGLAQLMLLVSLAGLIRSGRWKLAPTFLVYLLAVLTMEAVYVWYPSRFYGWPYWHLKQTVYDAAKLALAVDLAARICREFPGARVATSRWLLLVLLATAVGLVLRPWQHDFLLMVTGDLHARAVIGTLWLLVATFFAVRHYHLIVHPLHTGLLVGFGAYLAVWGILLRLMFVEGWAALDLWTRLDPPAYLAFSAWLAWVAWRPATVDTENYDAVMALLRQRANA